MDKSLKYRAICPSCGKAFDYRTDGVNRLGLIYCKDCGNDVKKFPFLTIDTIDNS